MSVTLDANLLLYASDEATPFHERARQLLVQVAAGPDIVYLFWPTVMAYLRLATHPAVFERPLPPENAVANVEALLALSHVQSPGEQERFWEVYRRVADDADARGNLVPDAHLVSLMIENGVRAIWTHGRDYRRFSDIEVRDPFA
ncbi:MAG: TA system VapC family ribonuclease toxin [Actinomycetota bacterium]